jgi:proteasome accessory factor B
VASVISNEERLFSLVLALLATETGLTKTDILSTVQGYRQRYRPGGSNASLERQFERDKDDVRELGVRIETIEHGADAGAAQFTRYRIPKGGYELPRDVRFTPQEVALLNLASLVWREGVQSGQSRRAITKLRSLGIEADEPLLAYAPRLRAREAAFEPLSEAIDRHQVVRFDYLKPGQERPEEREVEPLALVQFAGRWLVSGLDRHRDRERRSFLLSRIIGEVRVRTARFEPPPGDHAAEALAALHAWAEQHVAVLRVEPGTDAAVRLRERGRLREDGALELNYADGDLLADELTAFGPELVVESPPELAEAVRDRLLRVAAAHRGRRR